MTPGEEREEAALPALLAGLARDASDGLLIFSAAGGLIGAGLAIVLRTPLWPPIASAALCAAAFGAWGITDRELSERTAAGRAPTRLLELGRGAAAVLGAIAAVALLFSLASVGLGHWIS